MNLCRTCRWWSAYAPSREPHHGTCTSSEFPWGAYAEDAPDTEWTFGCTLWEPSSPVAHLFTEISQVASARIAFASLDRHWDNQPFAYPRS
jgi:hypothetical protein